MKLILVCCLPVLLFILFSSCDTNEPLPQGTIGLTLEDVSCTEAWITLTVGNLPGTVYIRITNNGNLIETLDVNATKTLLYYDTLQPNTNYEFQAFSSQRGEDIVGNKLQVTTLDTTSHNFTWQTFTFGEHSSSTLYDVAIIDENNIWAVGEIYMNDSLGNPDPQRYNAAIWDGTEWSVTRIPYFYQGQPFYNPIQSVFAFSANDIWFCGNGVIHWDGNNFIPMPIQTNIWVPYQMNKIWGSSKSDLYAVGDAGNIAHYNGSSWTKIESGTTTNINDFWGVIDPNNYQQIIYGAVSYVYQSGDRKILKIQNSKVDSIDWNTDRRIHSVWTFNNRYLYVAGGGIFDNRRGYWNEITEVPLYYSRNIRGTENNNIFVCGDFGLFAHFSGTSWKTYNELYIQGIYYSLSAKNNIAITVGFNGSKAIIIKGTRN